jgi:hypothetical protein
VTTRGGAAEVRLGPSGPYPSAPLTHPLDRRWLHYAFRSPDGALSVIANLSVLGASPGSGSRPQEMSILLVHDEAGWASSQFNAAVTGVPWSAFRLPDPGPRLRVGTPRGAPSVDLDLTRTGRACTSQCAPFAVDEHLRWQSEPGVRARGTLTGAAGRHAGSSLVGYHERVRGHWAWPHLGGWVFGFVNANGADADSPAAPPPFAVVFTLIQPPHPADAPTGSVMVWRHGRLLRHFPRRTLHVGVSGRLPRDLVDTAPPLAATLGTAPTAHVPGRLRITAASGDDDLTIDVTSATACRIVNPNELGMNGFSVHEVLGPGRVVGRVGGEDVEVEAPAVVEFAGGADVD